VNTGPKRKKPQAKNPARKTTSKRKPTSTKTRLDLGIILKVIEATDRLVTQPAMAMFPFKVGLTSVSEVDKELLSWLKKAFDAAG